MIGMYIMKDNKTQKQKQTQESFYAVARGRVTGVFSTWAECQKQVKGFNGAVFKKFDSRKDADNFVKGNGSIIFAQLGITDTFVPPPKLHKQTTSTNTATSSPTTTTTITHDPSDIVCFSDGSCLNNGKKSAKAGYACVFPNHPKYTTYAHLNPTHEYAVTNNRAEYSALILAIEIAAKIDPTQSKKLYFYTDSQLLINTMTKWMDAWKKKSWRKANGETVLNLDLVKQLDTFRSIRPIVYKHVEAHTGRQDWASVWNDKADELAKLAANTA